jgi:DNA-binding Xre family transcriptional regulator
MVIAAVRREKARIAKLYREASRKENAAAGMRLRLWRVGKKLSQKELGARLGMSQPAISLWETGAAPIDFARIERLCPVILEAFEEVPV